VAGAQATWSVSTGMALGGDSGQGNLTEATTLRRRPDGITPAATVLHGIVLRRSNGFGARSDRATHTAGVQEQSVGGTVAGACTSSNSTAPCVRFRQPCPSDQPNIGMPSWACIFENGRAIRPPSGNTT